MTDFQLCQWYRKGWNHAANEVSPPKFPNKEAEKAFSQGHEDYYEFLIDSDVCKESDEEILKLIKQ